MLRSGQGGLTPPPYGQPDRKISVFFFDGFPKVLSLPESVNVTFHEYTEWDNIFQNSKYFAVSLLTVTVLLSECQCHYC